MQTMNILGIFNAISMDSIYAQEGEEIIDEALILFKIIITGT